MARTVFEREGIDEDGAHQARDVGLREVIREAREELELSIRELARRSGISAGQISRIESGDVDKPSPSTLSALAAALGRSPVPLLYLAEHIDEDEFEASVTVTHHKLAAVGEFDTMDVRQQAAALWELTADLEGLVAELSPEAASHGRDIEEIAGALVRDDGGAPPGSYMRLSQIRLCSRSSTACQPLPVATSSRSTSKAGERC